MYSVPNFSNKSVERLGQQQQNAYMNYNNTDYQNGNMQYEQHQQNMYQNRSQNNSQMQNIYQQPPNTNSQSSFSQPGQDSFMYFERRPDLMTKATQDQAASVKLKMENYYQTAVNLAIERNQRRIEFENKLQYHHQEWSDERKYRELASLGKGVPVFKT